MKQSGWRLAAKRALDIGAAITGLVATAPVVAAVAVAIQTRMGSPVLFRQARPGRDGRTFTLYKFRTMRLPTADGPRDDAARLTPLGAFLRSTSLDELPQLFNVLRGDMSLVGPRPLLMEYLPRYSPRQARRHEVLPGITGWTAVHGRNALTWAEKFELDVWYVENWSLGLDVRILARTIVKVLRREGVAARGHVTMPEFTGGA